MGAMKRETMPKKKTNPESLIEQYQEHLDTVISNEEGPDVDEANIAMHNLAQELVKLRPRIVARVKWHTGRTTETEGVLHSLKGDKVYFESSFGLVEGDAESIGMA